MHHLKPLITSLIALTFLLQTVSVFAQDAISMSLSDPVIDSFPQVAVFVQVRDETGQPIRDIPPGAFSVFEDAQPIPIFRAEQVRVGTRLVYALNTSPALRIRDSLGRSRYDLVRTALLDWLALPDYATLGIDDLSLITAEGIELAHTRATADIASELGNLTPSFEIDGDYELLFRALDLTNEPAPMPGMPTYIFFITPLLRPSLEVSLDNIIARAVASQTTIYPILVGPPEILDQAEAEDFQLLADETGGALLRFDPDVGLLDLAREMIGQRTQYQLTYPSLATSSGPHEIKVGISLNQLEAETPTRTYILELLEPQVTLLNLPTEIQRSTDDSTMPLENIPPTSQTIEFAVQFPDGYPRPIIQSQLLVDGEIVDQRLQSPFSPLNWDLRDQLSDGTREIQVAVLDSLGYQASTLVSEVRFQIELPPRGLAAIRPALSSLLIALGVLLGGVALAAILLTAGQRSNAAAFNIKRQKVVQPSAVSRLRQEIPDEPIEAYLYPLEGTPESPGTIYLTGTEISIGRDPNFAVVPLDDPSVEGLHARLIRQVDGSYFLRDQGSQAGTWVQYKQIPDAGQKLAHGDIVHFGRSAYRFTFVDPPPEKEIRITRAGEPTEPLKDS